MNSAHLLQMRRRVIGRSRRFRRMATPTAGRRSLPVPRRPMDTRDTGAEEARRRTTGARRRVTEACHRHPGPRSSSSEARRRLITITVSRSLSFCFLVNSNSLFLNGANR